MNLFKIFNVLIVFAATIFISTIIHGQTERTAGEVTLTFRTVTANGNYSPRHVLAVWVEDENGFVKSRLVRASNRKQYLYTWIAASSYNETDAITGATLNSHQTHEVVWDCTDLDGSEVLDGTYTIHIEFTDKHAQGPVYSINFEKGIDEQHLSPLDQTYFKDVQLDFYPETTGINDQVLENELLIYPNPGKGIFFINHFPEEASEIIITDYAGKVVMSIPHKSIVDKEGLEIDLTNYKSGIYLLKLKINDQLITKKLIKK